MSTNGTPFTEQIRQTVRRSGYSQYRLCKLAKLDKATMSRFLCGERGLSTASLNRLAEVLDLRVTLGPANREAADKRHKNSAKTTRKQRGNAPGKRGLNGGGAKGKVTPS